MMNMIARATIGACIGYCVGTVIDAAANNRSSKPKHKAGEYCGSRWYNKAYQLAADNSVSWWQAKMQDSLDVLACGDHAPADRVLVTNKEARDLRTRFLAGRPRYNEDGGTSVTVSHSFGDTVYTVDECDFNVTFMMGFRQIQGCIIPEAHILCHELDSEKEWTSWTDFYRDAQEAIRRCRRLGFVSESEANKRGQSMYELGRELGQTEGRHPAPHKVSREFANKIENSPAHKMSELEGDDEYM